MPSSATKFLDQQITARMSRVCGGTIAAKRLVKIDGTDHTKIALAGANEKANGVAEIDGATGDEIPVATGGILAVRAGGTIALNDEVVSDSTGQVVARGTTATTLYHVVGRAITQAASGELVMIQWGPYAVWGANAS